MRQCATGGKGHGDLRIRQALCAYRQGRLKRVLSVYTQTEHDQTHQVQCHLHFQVSHEKEMREGTEFTYHSCSTERKNGTIVSAKSWLKGSPRPS